MLTRGKAVLFYSPYDGAPLSLLSLRLSPVRHYLRSQPMPAESLSPGGDQWQMYC